MVRLADDVLGYIDSRKDFWTAQTRGEDGAMWEKPERGRKMRIK